MHDNPNLYDELERCLLTQTPLRACACCLGTAGPDVPIRQLGRKQRKEWLREDHRPPIEATKRRLVH